MKVIVSFLLLASFITARAQDEGKGEFMPMVSRTLGVSFQDFDGLNSRVANLPQYKQLRSSSGTIGLGWLKENKQFVTTGSLIASSSMSGHQDEKSSTVRSLGITLDLGYDVIKSKKVMLYPFVGIGGQGYQAVFYKDNSEVNFNDVLQSPTVQNNIRAVKFKNAFFVGRAGLGLNVMSSRHPTCSIGLLAGYSGSFNESGWKSNEGQGLGNAPQDRVSQFFVSLVFNNKMGEMMKHHR